MLDHHLKQHPRAVWVHLYSKHMHLLEHPQQNIITTVHSHLEHEHSQTLIADFDATVLTLKTLLKQAQRPWYQPASILLLQVKEPLDHPLSHLEIRAISEVGYAAGARVVHVYNSEDHLLNPQPKDSTVFTLVQASAKLFLVLGFSLFLFSIWMDQ
ncbi:hypothetical protein [Acinetobacter sp. A2]|uniref:hypothetical protein n=1 Tax=Acinetobacter sp. A2 TaxID=362457 RepID=UPI00144579F9|nr:hypothetical protein [Acinetobacter sp. A2]